MHLIALAGLGRSGTSTVFRALTGLEPRSGRAEPRPGQLRLEDERLTRLSELEGNKPPVYAELVLWDVPGSPGQKGLGSDTVGTLRNADAVALVLRGFADPFAMVAPTPGEEALSLIGELLLSDLSVIEGRLKRLEKEGRREAEHTLLTKLKGSVEAEDLPAARSLPHRDAALLSGYQLFALKPLVLVLNLPEGASEETFPALLETADSLGVPVVPMWAKIETELLELDSDERNEFRQGLRIGPPASLVMLEAARDHLGVISFFTVGSHEVRAWPIRKGTTAVEAAGKIHTDMEKGFIRAEVVPFEDVVAAGSTAKARGVIRREERGYEVRDGEVIQFLFSPP